MSLTLPILSTADVGLFVLVLMRMSGFILFNPLLGRDEIPFMVKAGLSLLCSLIVTPNIGDMAGPLNGIGQTLVCCAWELLIGFLMGVLVSIIFGVTQLAGELIDMQMGITMATIYDPHSNMNMPLFGSCFNALMVMTFFAGDSHLALFALITDSFRLLPPGTLSIAPKAYKYIVGMGSDYFELGFRMAVPVLTVEVLCEIAIGMLMRAVPQINIFTIGIHLKAAIGIILVFISTAALAAMCGQLSSFIVEKCSVLVRLLGSG